MSMKIAEVAKANLQDIDDDRENEHYEKQLENILGVVKETALLYLQDEGVSIQSPKEFYHNIRWDVLSMTRYQMERDLDKLHFIPYLLLCQRNTGKFMVYKRPDKGNGESRLSGKHSVGFAGHVDAVDYRTSSKGVINVYDTCGASVMREAFEELKYTRKVGDRLDQLCAAAMTEDDLFHETELKDHGFIYDKSDEVGQTHLGIFMTLEVDEDLLVEGNEPQIEMPHWATLAEIYTGIKDGTYDFENWSTMLLQHLMQSITAINEAHLTADHAEWGVLPADTTVSLEPQSRLRGCAPGVIQVDEARFKALTLQERLILLTSGHQVESVGELARTMMSAQSSGISVPHRLIYGDRERMAKALGGGTFYCTDSQLQEMHQYLDTLGIVR